ncbi:hypothetical protein BGX27_000747 [Mortierella sp. AM989]|nr:hypothetical protein BGX27_000747 [Mortierella sp. AM989]
MFEKDGSVWEIIISSVERNPGLEALSLRYFPQPRMLGVDLLSTYKRLLEPLRALTTLDLMVTQSVDDEVFLYIARFAKQLQRLFFTFGLITSEKRGYTQDGIDTVMIDRTRLKELELISATFSHDHRYLTLFLKASPELEKWRLPSVNPKVAEEIVAVLRQFCPKLREICLDGASSTLEDNLLAGFIDSCRPSGLRSFRISFPPGKDNFGPQCMGRLCATSTTLEIVRIPVLGSSGLATLQHILSSCPNLRELSVLNDPCYDGIESEAIFAQDILKQPWITIKLEILRLPLTDVHAGEGKIQDKDYQLDFIDQLAKLTRLQLLDLTIPIWSNGEPYTSPLFSLQYGLHLLEGLKELRLLILESHCNGVGRQELEWMCKHWPRLERIRDIHIVTAERWWSSWNGCGSNDTVMPMRIRSILTKSNPKEICYGTEAFDL